MWFRTSEQARLGPWPVAVVEDTGSGCRSHIAREESAAATAAKREEARRRAEAAARAQTSCIVEGGLAGLAPGTFTLASGGGGGGGGGRGTVTLAITEGPWRGEAYVGEWNPAAGRPHGTGLLTYASGKTFRGTFVNGRPHGQGVLAHTHEYRGAFRHGEACGAGVTTRGFGHDARLSAVALTLKPGGEPDTAAETVALFEAGATKTIRCLIEQVL